MVHVCSIYPCSSCNELCPSVSRCDMRDTCDRSSDSSIDRANSSMTCHYRDLSPRRSCSGYMSMMYMSWVSHVTLRSRHRCWHWPRTVIDLRLTEETIKPCDILMRLDIHMWHTNESNRMIWHSLETVIVWSNMQPCLVIWDRNPQGLAVSDSSDMTWYEAI